MQSRSRRYSMDEQDVTKTLRDLGFFLLASLLTALSAWLSGFGQQHPDVYWVPIMTSIVAGLITGLNRWQRDNPPETPAEEKPDSPGDWSQM